MSFSRINFWIEGDISTTRIISRLLNDLVGAGNCDTRLLPTLDLTSLASGLNIFCRVCDPKYSWLPAYLKESGVRYAFYLDDNFWKITGSSDVARHYQSEPVVNALDEFVQGAEFVITHSSVMVEFIAYRFPNVRCKLLPVPFDISLVRNIQSQISHRNPPYPIVGYAGGYKEDEFSFLEKVINQLSKERPEIRFEFIGSISDKLRQLDSVQWFPGCSDYEKFLSLKINRHWAVGLAPLMENEFNAAKTNNKFREYGGCGIPGVYSNTSPYVECVRSEETGLLVENSVENWVGAIKTLVDDKSLHDRIKNEAFSFVDSNYSHQSISRAWRNALESIPENKPAKSFSRFRFHYVNQFSVNGSPSIAAALQNADIPSALVILFKSAGRTFLAKLTLRRVFILFFIGLVAANLFYMKVGSL